MNSMALSTSDQGIMDMSFDEIEEVDGAMAQLIGRGVMVGLAVVGCGTGVALVAGIAVGLAVAYYESQ